MQHRTSYFEGMDGIELYSQQWLPEGPPRAIIAIVHGIGDHSGRYNNVIQPMVSNDYGVYGYDLRGHGKSPGQRGHINAWKEYRLDLLSFIQMIKGQQSGLPIFLLGHSMGALIALDFMVSEREALAGAIISGAPIEPVGIAKPYLVALAHVLSRIYPKFSLDLGLDQDAISRQPSVVKAYQDDPLVYGKVSARWGIESLRTVESVKGQAGNIAIPILMVHGEADRLNSEEGAKKFFDQIQFQDKEFIGYVESYHEVHNDLEYERMVRDILDWLQRHIEEPS